MLNVVNKGVKGDDNQDATENIYNIMVTEFPTQWKDEKDDLVNSEKNNKLVQTNESETNVEANAQDIVFSMRRKVGGRRFLVDVSSAHMDKVTFYPEKKWSEVKVCYSKKDYS